LANECLALRSPLNHPNGQTASFAGELSASVSDGARRGLVRFQDAKPLTTPSTSYGSAVAPPECIPRLGRKLLDTQEISGWRERDSIGERDASARPPGHVSIEMRRQPDSDGTSNSCQRRPSPVRCNILEDQGLKRATSRFGKAVELPNARRQCAGGRSANVLTCYKCLVVKPKKKRRLARPLHRSS
jgi:hypothetical protein